MRTEARFPGVGFGAGHYESFYIKATRPGGGKGVWIRHTVHKRPAAPLEGSIWFTLFDAEAPGPLATKLTVPAPDVAAPPGDYIRVDGAALGPGRAVGEFASDDLDVSWELEFEAEAPAFHHLPYEFLYRAPLPKTKFLSPYPDARFSGTVRIDGEELALDAWPGMIGHNWGAEHAERWVWIEANELQGGDGYFDAAVGGSRSARDDPMGRQRDAPPRRRSSTASAASTGSAPPGSPTGRPRASSGHRKGRQGPRTGLGPAAQFVAWVYADPKGPEHNTLNCSISDLELVVERKGREPLRLESSGAAAYEIGMRDTDHGIALQPYPDG